jgi:hypothetical protein
MTTMGSGHGRQAVLVAAQALTAVDALTDLEVPLQEDFQWSLN